MLSIKLFDTFESERQFTAKRIVFIHRLPSAVTSQMLIVHYNFNFRFALWRLSINMRPVVNDKSGYEREYYMRTIYTYQHQ